MTVNINIKRKFKINGKEYNSIEEMPENIRDAVEKAIAAKSGLGHQAAEGVTRTSIIFNGTEYDNIDAMPQNVRQLYEKLLSASQTGSGSSEIDFPEIMRMQNDSASIGHDHADSIPQQTKFESSFSPRMLIICAGIIALLLLILYFKKGL